MWQRKQAAEMKRLERERKAQDIQQKKNLAEDKTIRAQKALDSMNEILSYTLNIDDTIDWESLKNKVNFSESKPSKPIYPVIPPKPNSKDERYKPKLGFLGGFSRKRQEKARNQANELFQNDMRNWKRNKRVEFDRYNRALEEYELFLKKQEEENRLINFKKENYFKCDCEAVLDYCDMVLSNSKISK
ncbi:hypothetical protein [Methanobacterium sp.]|uniref:hypothetical protein n=1 Tax=Methanobacterium sp. TaxID=2164 RepID=UPI003C76050B